WVVLKNDTQELDLKGSITYIRQSFQQSKNNQNLIGATIGENYNHLFAHGILFVQQLAVTPAFNNSNAYSAFGNAALTIPFYKRLNLGVGAADAFLNNPPPGFKKNSFQFTTGVTYTLPRWFSKHHISVSGSTSITSAVAGHLLFTAKSCTRRNCSLSILRLADLISI